MSEPAVDALKVRSPRLEQDEFHLYPWAWGKGDAGRRTGRQHSTRATADDQPTESPGEPSSLDAFGGGVADE